MLKTDKEKKQLLNISKTILEATNHLLKMTKEKQYQESLYIFTSIIEGYNAIHTMISNSEYKEQLSTYEERFLKSINLIAQELEKSNLLKVTEILQFTFAPLVKKWNNDIQTIFSDELAEKQVTIGIYNDSKSPMEIYPEERINALIEEAKKANANLIFFTSEGVNLNDKLITGDVFQNGSWTKETVPYPDVINNILPKTVVRQSRIERKLRREIPFTSFALGNKIELPRRLVKYKNYADLLVPFKIVKNEQVVVDYVIENKKAVLKPILGNQGRYIYFLEEKNGKFILTEHKSKKILNKDELIKFIKGLNINNNIFIIQKYINARTKLGEPFDLRAHMQKDGKGEWQITRLYPRIGPKESILSNISRGGRSDDLEEFFNKEFNQSEELLQKTKELAMDLTQYLDRIHGFALDELGLDITIDEKQKFWLHEANLGPQTTYHEDLRAKNLIAYAKYLAENQIFHSNVYNEKSFIKGAFDSSKANLELAKLNYDISIGMLVHPDEINDLVEACAYVAKFEEVNFFYFTPNDIDYEEMLIRGHFYINYEWKPMIVEYPDVIYDRLRLKGIKEYDDLYQEFQGIPFTNEFDGGSANKLEVYNLLKTSSDLEPHIIPFERVDKANQVIRQLNEYKKVIVKPTRGSFAMGVHYIEKLNNFDYLVIHKDNERNINEFELNQYMRNLIKKGEWVIQKFIETRTKENYPFDIRVHLMKDQSNDWSFVNIYPRVGYHFATIASTGLGGYIGNINGFIKRHFDSSDILISRIKELSLIIASNFEEFYSHKISELGVDLAVDKNMNIFIIEVNVNKVGIIYYEFDVAKHAIAYAKRLAMQQK